MTMSETTEGIESSRSPRPPYPSCPSRPFDADGVKRAVRLYLQSIGEDPDREGLKDTPDRIARASQEIFSGMSQNPRDVLGARFNVATEDLVVVRDIEFYSVCEHHLLPFHGLAHIGYIPDKNRVVGLSKLARLVQVFAHRPQIQERLTQQIADALMDELGAKGAIVITDCEHMCMSMRGVKESQARTVTSAVRGYLRQSDTRAEALRLILDAPQLR